MSVFGTLSFILKCRIALIILGCILCFGAGFGVAALCRGPQEAAAPPADPIWAVPLGEDFRYEADGEGRIVIACEVHNTLHQPIFLSDVYIAGDPAVLSIEVEPFSLPAGQSGALEITAALDETCRVRTVKHRADIDMIFRWERGSALITLPMTFHTVPAPS